VKSGHENLKGRDRLENLGVDERTILLVNLMEKGREIRDPIQLDYNRSRN
jgi:hypothetical protein